jgi:hypothetical protein
LARFKNRGTSKSANGEITECELAMEVADPSGDPGAKAVMLVWLAKDSGLWRVTHVGFEPKRALAIAKAPAAQPTNGS